MVAKSDATRPSQKEEAEALTPGEMRQLRAVAEQRFGAGGNTDREADFWIALLEQGLVSKLPALAVEYEDFEPIHIDGPPLSQTIIEERR